MTYNNTNKSIKSYTERISCAFISTLGWAAFNGHAQ